MDALAQQAEINRVKLWLLGISPAEQAAFRRKLEREQQAEREHNERVARRRAAARVW